MSELEAQLRELEAQLRELEAQWQQLADQIQEAKSPREPLAEVLWTNWGDTTIQQQQKFIALP